MGLSNILFDDDMDRGFSLGSYLRISCSDCGDALRRYRAELLWGARCSHCAFKFEHRDDTPKPKKTKKQRAK